MSTIEKAQAAAVAGLMFTSVLLGMVLNTPEVKTKFIKIIQHSVVYKNVKDDFSEQKLKEYILELNLRYPEVILAQAKLESGNYTSRAFREQNNLFGLHVARQRPTLAKKGKGKLAHYNSWRDSVVDYAFLVADRMRKLHSREEYLKYLDANYDVPGYSKKLLKFI